MKALQILVVEDDACVAMVLGELLAGMGHTVCETASTQADAVTGALRLRPDLMIVDEGLQQGDGVSAVEEIHRAGPPIAHVFVSGNPGRLQQHKPGALVIRKPFRMNDLTRAMETALGAVAAD